MQVESEGKVDEHQMKRGRSTGSERDVGQENVGQRSRWKEKVENDCQDRSENCPGENQEQKESDSFFTLSHPGSFLG